MKYLIILLVVGCSQPICPKVSIEWEMLDTVIVWSEKDSIDKIRYKNELVWHPWHDCTMHQVLIENLGDSNEVVTIGAPGDMRLAKSPGEVVNFMLDSMGYHLVRNCLEYSGFQ
jgi:hypothetical protein